MVEIQAWEYALELRYELEEWWRSPVGLRFGEGWSNVRSQRNKLRIGDIASIELNKLPIASPFFVSNEMVDLLEHAAETFPPTPLHPVDLPLDAGFVLLGRSVDTIDVQLKPLPWRAFAWRLGHDRENPEDAIGVHLSVYAHKDDDPQRAEAETEFGTRHVFFSTLSLVHDTVWDFASDYANPERWTGGTQMSEGMTNADIPKEAHESGVAMMRLIHTFFILSQQRIGEASSRYASRPVRRRIERAYPQREIPEVRVITLRRRKLPKHGDEEVGSGREYTHRWWVNGHWRRQWYPSENRHRPKFIEGYVKGPEDKPFQQKDTAYVWRR